MLDDDLTDNKDNNNSKSGANSGAAEDPGANKNNNSSGSGSAPKVETVPVPPKTDLPKKENKTSDKIRGGVSNIYEHIRSYFSRGSTLDKVKRVGKIVAISGGITLGGVFGYKLYQYSNASDSKKQGIVQEKETSKKSKKDNTNKSANEIKKGSSKIKEDAYVFNEKSDSTIYFKNLNGISKTDVLTEFDLMLYNAFLYSVKRHPSKQIENEISKNLKNKFNSRLNDLRTSFSIKSDPGKKNPATYLVEGREVQNVEHNTNLANLLFGDDDSLLITRYGEILENTNFDSSSYSKECVRERMISYIARNVFDTTSNGVNYSNMKKTLQQLQQEYRTEKDTTNDNFLKICNLLENEYKDDLNSNKKALFLEDMFAKEEIVQQATTNDKNNDVILYLLGIAALAGAGIGYGVYKNNKKKDGKNNNKKEKADKDSKPKNGSKGITAVAPMLLLSTALGMSYLTSCSSSKSENEVNGYKELSSEAIELKKCSFIEAQNMDFIDALYSGRMDIPQEVTLYLKNKFEEYKLQKVALKDGTEMTKYDALMYFLKERNNRNLFDATFSTKGYDKSISNLESLLDDLVSDYSNIDVVESHMRELMAIGHEIGNYKLLDILIEQSSTLNAGIACKDKYDQIRQKELAKSYKTFSDDQSSYQEIMHTYVSEDSLVGARDVSRRKVYDFEQTLSKMKDKVKSPQLASECLFIIKEIKSFYDNKVMSYPEQLNEVYQKMLQIKEGRKPAGGPAAPSLVI